MNKPITKENFFSNSSPPLQKISGKIVYQEPKKVYKKNEFHGNTYFKLQVAHEEEKHIFFVYPNLVSKQLFNDIVQYNHAGKEYIFFCEKRKKGG
jgi:acetylornithine/succinyldiaminopimelate/putrescine aminotransferase